MAKSSHSENDQYSDKETAQRRDAVIKHMIAMPPKPHSEMKLGKKKKPTPKITTKVRTRHVTKTENSS
jgi:hypothetical protein